MKGIHKIYTGCVIATLALASQSATAKAEEIPVAGINLVLHNYFQNIESDTNSIRDYLSELNQYKGIAFAKVNDYVNVRSVPSEEGDILGKLYSNSAATILEKSDDWYEVKSGSVTGYIKAEYLMIGEEAEKLTKEVGKQVALVTTDTLKVREKPTVESTVLTLVAKGDQFIVKQEKNGWFKIVYEGDKTGFVSADYVDVNYEFEEAISIAEEQERILAEQEAVQAEQIRVAEQEALRAEERRTASIAEANEKSQISDNVVIKNYDANSSAVRNRIVEYALRFEGNPYVWGGTSLTNGADCSGFTQSVFRDNGISIPRTSRTQAISGKRISIDDMQPGDLIFYERNGTINHVGIYIGNGKVIAASSPETGIRITNYNYRNPYRVVSYIND